MGKPEVLDHSPASMPFLVSSIAWFDSAILESALILHFLKHVNNVNPQLSQITLITKTPEKCFSKIAKLRKRLNRPNRQRDRNAET